MFAGGSNRIRNGALINDEDHHYHPVTSNYDYDALLTESGALTPKYDAVRRAIADIYPSLIDNELQTVTILLMIMFEKSDSSYLIRKSLFHRLMSCRIAKLLPNKWRRFSIGHLLVSIYNVNQNQTQRNYHYFCDVFHLLYFFITIVTLGLE
jgi:hypothetical protein